MIDLAELRDFLLMKRADPSLVAWANAELLDANPSPFESLPPLAYEDTGLLLAGVLELSVPVGAPLEQAPVQRFLQLCEQLGFDDAWIDAFVQQRLRMSLEVLTAMAWLRLPLGADAEQVHGAHRRLAKLYHPDRLTHLADELQDLARTRTVELNRARDVLMAHLASPPIPLDPMPEPDPDWEDAPTDVDGDTEMLDLID